MTKVSKEEFEAGAPAVSPSTYFVADCFIESVIVFPDDKPIYV